MDYEIAQTVDAKGLMCPMPLVNARKAIMAIEVGAVMRVEATDKGSVKDFQGWAKAAKNVELVEQGEATEGNNTIYYHIVRRTK